MLSVVQAPLRMVAHTGFVIGSLTGLRLEWKSPPRAAGAVRWRDTTARFGPYSLLALSAVVLLLTTREGGLQLPSYLLPVLLPLLFAVPFAVLTGDPRVGVALQRMGLLGGRTKDGWRTSRQPGPAPWAARNVTFARRPVAAGCRRSGRGAPWPPTPASRRCSSR